MQSTNKLFEVRIQGYRSRHVVSTEPQAAIALVNFWLFERKHHGDHTILVREVSPHELRPREQKHLTELLAENMVGMAYYDAEVGWTLHSVSDDPNP